MNALGIHKIGKRLSDERFNSCVDAYTNQLIEIDKDLRFNDAEKRTKKDELYNKFREAYRIEE